MPKIEKTKTGYRARVSTGERLPSGGYRYISLSAATKAEVRRMIADFDENRENALSANLAGRVTLAQAMDKYLDTCRAAGRSPATIRGYVTMRRNGFETLETKPIVKISRADIQSMVNDWTRSGATPKTVRNKLSFLSAAMKHAGIEPPMQGLILPEPDRKEMTIPQDEDVQRALFYLRAHNTNLYVAVVLAATLGLRRGEIAALTMDDFDFDAGTVTISKSLAMDERGDYITKAPKSRSGNRVLRGLDALVVSAVRSYGHQPPQTITGLTPAAISCAYADVCAKLNLPGRFHDLRHYAASVMAALNVPPKYAQERMGHATLDMLNRVYQHTMDKKRDAVADAIASHNVALLGGEVCQYK